MQKNTQATPQIKQNAKESHVIIVTQKSVCTNCMLCMGPIGHMTVCSLCILHHF